MQNKKDKRTKSVATKVTADLVKKEENGKTDAKKGWKKQGPTVLMKQSMQSQANSGIDPKGRLIGELQETANNQHKMFIQN